MSHVLRVLIYTHTFAPKTGGVQTVVMSLAKGLACRKQADGTTSADVTVVTRTPPGAFDDASLPFKVVRRPSRRKLVRLIRVMDIIHLAGPAFLPLVVALFLRKPVVVEHHGFQAICPNGQLLYEPAQKLCPGHFMAGHHRECIQCNAKRGLLRSSLMWFLTFPRRWLCMGVQANITPTNWLRDLLHLPRSTTIYHGLPVIGPNGVSPSSPSRPTFAFVGRLVSSKGVPILLSALQQLSTEGFGYVLKVIGDGPDLGALQQQAVAFGLGDAVRFLGYLPPDRLEEHMMEVGTVVLPSLAGEVFGMVAAESMFRGKLVVVSNVGAMREVVGDSGLSFEPGDVQGLASCLRRVLNEQDLAKSLGQKARHRALQLFLEDRMIAKHLELYYQVAGKSGLSPRQVGEEG